MNEMLPEGPTAAFASQIPPPNVSPLAFLGQNGSQDGGKSPSLAQNSFHAHLAISLHPKVLSKGRIIGGGGVVEGLPAFWLPLEHIID